MLMIWVCFILLLFLLLFFLTHMTLMGHGEPKTTGVWSDQGRLVRYVKGASGDRVVDLVWHPVRRAIFSCGSSGTIYSWTTIVTEHWSVYAPTFTELEENEEYVEREDEFDFADGEVPRTEGGTLLADALASGQPPTKSPRVSQEVAPQTPEVKEEVKEKEKEEVKKEEEMKHIDITTKEPLSAYWSGSEDESAEDRAPQLRTIMPELTAFIDQDALVLEEEDGEEGESAEKPQPAPTEDKKETPASTSQA